MRRGSLFTIPKIGLFKSHKIYSQIAQHGRIRWVVPEWSRTMYGKTLPADRWRCWQEAGMKKRSSMPIAIPVGPASVGALTGRCDYWSFISLCVGIPAFMACIIWKASFSAYAWRVTTWDAFIALLFSYWRFIPSLVRSWWYGGISSLGQSLDGLPLVKRLIRPPKWLGLPYPVAQIAAISKTGNPKIGS